MLFEEIYTNKYLLSNLPTTYYAADLYRDLSSPKINPREKVSLIFFYILKDNSVRRASSAI